MDANALAVEIGNEEDLSWGMGYDYAQAGGSREDCPYDPAEKPVAYAEWQAGWEDGNR